MVIKSIDEVEEQKIEKAILIDLASWITEQYDYRDGAVSVWRIARFSKKRFGEK